MDAPSTACAADSLKYVLERAEDSRDRQQPVSEAIRLSWQRSAQAGLVPDQIHARYDPDIDDDSKLRWAAAPAMTAVSADLPDLPFALLLTDRRCHVIERWTRTARTAMLMDSIGAAAGFVCDETSVGTNSIGLATHTRAPAAVRGYEHFADALTQVSCASRPVLDPRTGQLLGVINLTAADPTYNTVAPALIGRIVHETRQRLLDESAARSTALHDCFLLARRRRRGPIAAVDADSLFVNAAAGRLVAATDRALLWDYAQRQVGSTATGEREPLLLASGAQTASCEPVHDGGRMVGVIVHMASDETGQPVPYSAGWSQLSASERSVAEHVAAGLTNRETATKLFISAHTVDYHLRQIYRKLDIQSRVDLARIASRNAVRSPPASRTP